MAFNDVPLEDAGPNYYQRQFGGRVQNIRKAGARPPAPTRNAGCLGAGGGVVALIVVVRIIIAVAIGVGTSSYDSSYNNYNYTPAPITVPEIPDGNNGLNNDQADQDRFPWLRQNPDEPFRLPPNDPILVPPADPNPPELRPGDLPVIVDPPADPPADPRDGDKLPGKDD